MRIKDSFFLLVLIILNILYFSDISYSMGEKQSGFVDIKEIIPQIELDIRYYGSHNFLGEKVDGYLAPKCILTKEAAEALLGVQRDIEPFGFTLKIYDCYRPQRAVDHFVRWAKKIENTKTKKEFYPTVDKQNLFKDGYIDSKSSHSRGSTVDLTIVPLPVPEQEEYTPGQKLYECYLTSEKRFKDNSIDMGTGFDCFHELSHTANEPVGKLILTQALYPFHPVFLLIDLCFRFSFAKSFVLFIQQVFFYEIISPDCS